MGSLLITNDPVALAREFEAHSAQWKAGTALLSSTTASPLTVS